MKLVRKRRKKEEKSKHRRFRNVSVINFMIVLHRSSFINQLVFIFDVVNSFYAPYALGDTRATMDGTKDRDPARVS